MAKQKEGEDLPKWRETPLDHWSKDIDPVIMAGDEWVDDKSEPGGKTSQEELNRRPPAPFMHPMHDTGYDNHDTESHHRPAANRSNRLKK